MSCVVVVKSKRIRCCLSSLNTLLVTTRRLYQVWHKHLGAQLTTHLQISEKITGWDGDVTQPALGLSEKHLQILRTRVNYFVHSASSISLGAPLKRMIPSVILASLEAAHLALSCEKLIRFVYVSTAYANAHVHDLFDGTDYGIIGEDIYPLMDGSLNFVSAASELSSILEGGMPSDPTILRHFPWAYAYAKHLTERLLTNLFAASLKSESIRISGSIPLTPTKPTLLILRPSGIGPALYSPFPNYSVAHSTPFTIVAADLITSLDLKPLIFASAYTDPMSETWWDEIPVDIVVNRLLLHLAAGTQGVVHAACGGELSRQRANLPMAVAAANRERVLPWPVSTAHVHPRGIWNVQGVCQTDRLYKFLMTRFDFGDVRTEEVLAAIVGWKETEREVKGWPMFAPATPIEFESRRVYYREIVEEVARKKGWSNGAVDVLCKRPCEAESTTAEDKEGIRSRL